MSCLGPNYTITTKPPWSRKRSVCFDVVNYIAVENNETTNNNDFIYVPLFKKYILLSELKNAFDMYNKGNVLQYAYIHHNGKLTKNQRFALISKGKWTTRKSFATQSDRFTNPNTHLLKRVNYDTINVETGAQSTSQTITCPTRTPQPYVNVLPVTNNTPSTVPNILPGPPPTPSNNKFTLPDIFPVVNNVIETVIPDGGNLIIGTIENICTGESKIICDIDPFVCFPSSASNVPFDNGEDKDLCYIKGAPTWLPKKQGQSSTSDNNDNSLQNYNNFESANGIIPRNIL